MCEVTAPTSIPEEEVTAHLTGQTQEDLKLATEYLRNYYNLKKEQPLARIKRYLPSFTSKVKDMQSFFGLNTTGSLDSETLEVMSTPRCGVSDVEDYSHNNRVNRWNKNVITYSIGRYTSDLPHSTVDSLIESALSVWARASTLTFVRSRTQRADIMVEFATFEHGDAYPFDGSKGTLAHAFGPGEGIGGDAHFDDDETWTAGSKGFNLYLVAAHEFGHSLGLRHSQNPESLMYPTYKSSRSSHNLLSKEDIAIINSLYGPKNSQPYYYSRHGWNQLYNPWFLGSHFPLMLQNKCSADLSFDAVSTLGDATFFFKDKYVHPPSDRFCSDTLLPLSATAESMYWTVKGSIVKGKPKPISNFGFPPWVQEVDAAVHIVKTGRTLFFIHDIYYRYMWLRTTWKTYWNRLRDGPNSTYLPSINYPVGAANDIPAKGVAYVFTGNVQSDRLKGLT
ncbi:matrilysin [Oncorhynchus mykiss]|uniref:matrilysin n=1 Tax=Oncorhynchus mykiss TaxID=8022 RepID=UPI0018775FF0|nr:matrilysin [Oncorhynchus mykiss]